MESVFIDRRDVALDVEGGVLLVRHPDEPRPVGFPLQNVERVVISGRAQLTSSVIQACTRAGVSLVLLNPRAADVCSVTMPWRHGNAARRLAQYRLSDDGAFCLDASRALVRAKLLSQARTLRRMLRHYPSERRAITRALDRVGQALVRLKEATDVASLRGMEGSAARSYFLALSCCTPTGLRFTGRNRRPPRDPVNAALSLSYVILHSEAVRALCGAGLDPMLGFFHEVSYNRESLACDLVELFRARVDYWVLSLFRRQVLRLEHFTLPEDGTQDVACLMSKTGRANYYPEWDLAARGWRRAMRRIAARWARIVLDESGDREHGSYGPGHDRH